MTTSTSSRRKRAKAFMQCFVLYQRRCEQDHLHNVWPHGVHNRLQICGITSCMAARLVERAWRGHSRGQMHWAMQTALERVLDVPDCAMVLTHHSARFPGFVLRSAASPQFERTWASSFAKAKGHRLMAMHGPAPTGIRVVYIHAYVSLTPATALPQRDGRTRECAQSAAVHAEDWAGPYALVEALADCKVVTIANTQTFAAAPPKSGIELKELHLLTLGDILSPQIVLSAAPGQSPELLRFLPCS
jgi:hypothetical protein